MNRQVMLVEDNAITSQSLIAKINAFPGLEVSAADSTFTDASSRLQHYTPDVLLVDLGLPDGSGLDIIRHMAKKEPQLAIMVVTVFGDEKTVMRALKAGATGYLLKDEDSEDIGSAIERLLNGGSPISPSIARQIIKQFAPSASDNDNEVELSAREKEVLSLAAKGFTYNEIADLLDVSINTIGSYTKRIYTKLAVKSRSEAVYEATRLGLM